MTRFAINADVVVDVDGVLRAVTGARVAVTDVSTGLPATVYLADTGLGEIAVPLVSSHGRVEGFLESGAYDLAVTGTAAQTGIQPNGIEPYTERIQFSTGGVSGVTSVAGRTGDVVLGKPDVGLANVDNTSDAGKPVSTAQQAALDLKAPLASPTFTGDPKAPTPTAGDNDTSIATTAFVHGEVATEASARAAADTAHEADTTGVHGIADTSALVVTSDARLSDTRTPTDGSVTAAKVAASLKPSGSAAAGTEALRALGTSGSTAAAGNDSRLSDARTPTDGSVTAAKVAASLKPSGSAAAGDEALRALGTTASTAAAGNDSRLSDARTPTAHKTSHATGGSDALAPSDIGAAPVASPTFTGTPAAPTAAQGTNTTQLATTAYVQTETGLLVPQSSVDTDGTLAANSDSKIPSQKAVRTYVGSVDSSVVHNSLIDAKGDLVVGTADNTPARKAVGTNGKTLVADSSQADGLLWTNVFGHLDSSYDGVLAQSFPLRFIQINPANTRPSSGRIEMVKIPIPYTMPVTNILLDINQVGVSLTANQSFAFLVDSTGARIGITADMSGTWTSTGEPTTMPIAGGPIVIPGGPGVYIYGSVLCVGTTTVGTRALNASATVLSQTLGVAAKWAVSNLTGQTSVPANLNLSSNLADNNFFWMGLT